MAAKAKAKVKVEEQTADERLAQALVPESKHPYAVPANWVWVRLGSITKIIGGGTPSTNVSEYYKDGDISWISPADLSNYESMYIAHGRKNITQLGLEKSSARLMPMNTVLLSSRAPIGYVAIAQSELCTNQGFKSFLPSPTYKPEYLYFYLKYIKETLESYASGTTFLELSGSKAALVEFPLPPLPEQRRIVERIESLFEKLDRAKELAQSALDSVETRKAAILHKAFTGELTAKWREENGVGLDSWEEKTLNALCVKITDGTHNSPVNSECGDYMYITAKNIKEHGIDLTNITFVDKEVHDEIYARCNVIFGDVLYIKDGATTGVATLNSVHEPFSMLSSVALLKPNKKLLDGKYLVYALNSPNTKSKMTNNMSGSAITRLTIMKIKESTVELPSLPEQQEIVRILDSLLEKEQRARELCDVIGKIDLMKKAILARAFRGELGTNDPNEDSAMGLLVQTLSV